MPQDTSFAVFRQYLLDRVPVTEWEIATIHTALRLRQVRRGQRVLEPGDVCHYQYFIVRGLTRLFETDERGKEHTFQFGSENTWTGDLESYIYRTPAHLCVECLEETTFLLMTRDGYDELLARFPVLERLFRQLFQVAYISTTQRTRLLLSQSATVRYLAFRQLYPALAARIPKRYIASYLGITPEALSRLLHRLPPENP